MPICLGIIYGYSLTIAEELSTCIREQMALKHLLPGPFKKTC